MTVTLAELRPFLRDKEPTAAAIVTVLVAEADVSPALLAFRADRHLGAVRIRLGDIVLGYLLRSDAYAWFPSKLKAFGDDRNSVLPRKARPDSPSLTRLVCPEHGCQDNPLLTIAYDPAAPPHCLLHGHALAEQPPASGPSSGTDDHLAEDARMPEPSDRRPPVGEEPPQRRNWRADIEDTDPDEPLDVGTEYALLISVDPETGGAVATGSFDESLFHDESVESLALTVQVSSTDFHVHSEAITGLRVPRAGRTPAPARFVVSPRHAGACTITAAVHLSGNFVCLLHLTVWAGTKGPATLTTVGRPPDALMHLRPRDTMLVLQRASGGGYQCMVKANGVLSPNVFLPITTDELAAEVAHVQQALMRLINHPDPAGELVFQTGIQIPAAMEQVALELMAKAGGRFFRKLFFHALAGPDAKELGAYLRAEASDEQALLTLQVVDTEAAIPWALLYVGDISDDAALAWDRFLGMRHLIEQIPLGPMLLGRTLTIPSAPELAVGVNVNLRIGSDVLNARAREHSEALRNLPARRPRLALTERNTRSAVLDALTDPTNSDQIVYFYCHATAQGKGDTGLASITIEPDAPLTLDNLTDNAGPEVQLAHHPLVFINACESAQLTPLFYAGFVPYFLSRGARGVLGTLCKTPALFAIRFAEALLDRLFDGQPIGESVLVTRRDFLDRYRNPLGLVYALHCDINTHIDPPMHATGA